MESNTDEKIIGMLAYKANMQCIVVSKLGKGFIADLKDIQTSQKKGKQLLNLTMLRYLAVSAKLID